MKKENRMDDKAKSPDPDDLTSEAPVPPPERRPPAEGREPAKDAVPGQPGDVSAPHIPPAD
jgi:hypothetical protein